MSIQPQPQFRFGDVVNGHVLTPQGWVRVAPQQQPQQVVVKNAQHPVSGTLWVVGTLVTLFFVIPVGFVMFMFVAMGAI